MHLRQSGLTMPVFRYARSLCASLCSGYGAYARAGTVRQSDRAARSEAQPSGNSVAACGRSARALRHRARAQRRLRVLQFCGGGLALVSHLRSSESPGLRHRALEALGAGKISTRRCARARSPES